MHVMNAEEFENLVAQEWEHALPEKFKHLISNVAFLVAEEPSEEIRVREGLSPHETLLGYYHGIPHTARGDHYGVGATMPDTITLYRIPIEHEAAITGLPIEKVIRDTLWHEVAHHFGFDEESVRHKEEKRRNEEA